ncbi:MAG TPA: hypothetical protein PLA68_12645 [Panacibacter sp.]|nr:hypothetical protein [Panacibacter sp.]
MRINFRVITCSMFVLSMCIACRHSGHDGANTSVKISESNGEYCMSAYFNGNKTKKIHEYMDQHLGDHHNFSFANTTIDGSLTLDDRTTFYIKASDGDLEIKLDKEKNSYESYTRVKKMCEGIKEIIGKD